MSEREKKWKEHIPEETRAHYKKAREEMREAVKGFPAGRRPGAPPQCPP
ncbi:MAG: hypothetical protein MZV63_06675 [Marinilabiliales bacterium]|nr:hypothetical protein [Marinilabiliales bacterium]